MRRVTMLLSRRQILAASAIIPVMAGPIRAAAATPVSLTYAAGRLTWPGGETRAVCGRGGVRADKREGDGASPEGSFPLLYGFYRADRVARPPSGLAMTALHPDDGWVDDPQDPNYNRLVKLPYAASHEEMWLADRLYDLVVVIGYNTDPVVAGRGSAIFLHVAREDFSPTAGCIAIERDALARLSGLLGPGSTITIRA
jgi:L,D-peptidoglycan transpeptidase YkuD (ErfK/YbiS/YcfS/YnhG family)